MAKCSSLNVGDRKSAFPTQFFLLPHIFKNDHNQNKMNTYVYYIQGYLSPVLILSLFSGMETNCLKKGWYLFAMTKCPREAAGLCKQALFLGSIYGKKRRQAIEEKRCWHRSRKKKKCLVGKAPQQYDGAFLWSHRQQSPALHCWQGALSKCISCMWNLLLYTDIPARERPQVPPPTQPTHPPGQAWLEGNSQFWVQQVQVAHIVYVVGRAEPRQDQQ